MKKNALRYVVSAAVSLVAVYAVVMSSGCSSSSEDTTPPPPPPATKTTYTGTIYMASETGGHIVAVPVNIDPSNTAAPITLTANPTRLADLMSPGGTSHRFHDVRLDGAANKLYYSAIFTDPAYADTATVHLGYVDVSPGGGNAKHDRVLDAQPGTTGMVYCGSGQTANYFLPITMSHPAYIDVISKSDIVDNVALSSATNVKRTFIEDFRSDSDYVFAHGVNSPDQSKLFVAVNDTNAAGGGKAAEMKGAVTTYLLDAGAVVGGTVDPSSVTTSQTITGLSAAGATIAFRSTYTPDGSKILQAGKDRLLVLDGSNLDVIANDINIGGSYRANGVENHDVIPTPDGKYAILALRYRVHSGDLYNDSGLQLYDLTKNQPVGDIVSTCKTCHDSSSKHRNTCGIDAKLNTVTQ